MSQIMVIALGGALGAIMRFLLASRMQSVVSNEILGVPVSTFIVNLVGSLLIGVAYVLLTEKLLFPPTWRPFVTIGFLSAFTTFSTFSLDIIQLLEAGHLTVAIAYIMASVLLCVTACWLGILVTRLF